MRLLIVVISCVLSYFIFAKAIENVLNFVSFCFASQVLDYEYDMYK